MSAPARRAALAAALGGLFCLAAAPPQPANRHTARAAGYRIVHAYPHDPNAYTQGLIFRDGYLYESTGLNGRSSLRKVALETGAVLKEYRVDPAYFAEGLTEMNGRLIQLTWQTNVAFIYDRATFAPLRSFSYPGEGWGLTDNRRELILSDGTEYLRFLDGGTFRETRRLRVTDGGAPVRALNELEYVRGEIYANVWHTDRIARIVPQSGRVLGWIDLHGLLSPMYLPDPEAVLNGIAYDPAKSRLFVTGKLWPKLFEIQVVAGR